MATKNKKENPIEIDPYKNYTFKLTTEHFGQYVLPNEAKIWDEESSRQRFIRYSDAEESIYKDEQEEDAGISSDTIRFIKGVLTVSGQQAAKIKYLLAFDGNADKEKVMPNRVLSFKYKLIDEEKEFKDKADLRKLKLKVQNALLAATKEELHDFLVSEYGYNAITTSQDELLDVALNYAERDPSYVSKNFNTEESKMKAKIIKAFKEGVITNTKGVITWTTSGMEVQAFKLGEDDKITDLMWSWIAKGSKESTDFVKKLSLK